MTNPTDQQRIDELSEQLQDYFAQIAEWKRRAELRAIPIVGAIVDGLINEQREQPPLRAILEFAPEALAELLQLPAGAVIERAETALDRPGVLLLQISGAGWPVRIGERIPSTTGSVTREFEDGREVRTTIDWKFQARNE